MCVHQVCGDAWLRPHGGYIPSLMSTPHISTPSHQVDWAHLDIASTGWNFEKSFGTGYGVQLLTKWASSYGKE